MGLFSKVVLALASIGLALWLAVAFPIPNRAEAHGACMGAGGWVDSTPGGVTWCVMN